MINHITIVYHSWQF